MPSSGQTTTPPIIRGLPIGPQPLQPCLPLEFGEASVMSVMPQAVVDCIVDLSRSGLSRAIIASKVGLSRSSVCAALWRRGEKPAAKVTRTNTNAQPPGAAACQASIEIAPHGCYWRILLQKCVEGCREQ